MEALELLTALLRSLAGEAPVDPEQLAQGLASESPRCRQAALELARRDLLRFAPELLEAWLRRPEARAAIEPLLARDPLLALEARFPEKVAAVQPGADGPGVQAWFAPDRARRLLETLAGCERALTPGSLLALSKLPGLLQQAARSPASPLSAQVRAEIERQLAEADARRFPGALAIVPSYRCARGCSYCFAQGLGARFPESLDMERLCRAIDVALAGGSVRRVNVFGGEPTQYEGLAGLLDQLHARGLSAFFSTNGLCPPQRFSALLASPCLEMVTVHVSRRADYRAAELDVLRENLRALGRSRAQAVVRYTLVDEAQRDWELLASALDELPGAHFSFAVAFPSEAGGNRHCAFAALERFAPKIMSLVRFLGAASPASRPFVLAKPFPLCAFGPEDLHELLARVQIHGVCELHRRGFRDQILMQPDLTMSPCMALSSSRFAIERPLSIEQAGPIFEERLAPLLARPLGPSCAACSLFRIGACQAACHAYAQAED